MRSTLLFYLDLVLKSGLLLIAFALPLLFTPLTVDGFEFPKQIFLYTMTLFLVLVWLFKFVVERKVQITRTPLDLPIFILLLAYILSTIFAPVKYTALVGFFGRPHESLISIATLILLYYFIVSNVKTASMIKSLLLSLTASVFFVSLFGILQYFGIFTLSFFDFTKTRTFTPVGPSVTILAILAALAFPLLWSLVMYVQNIVEKLVLSLMALPIGLMIILANIPAAWLTLVVGLFIMFFWNKTSNLKRNSNFFLIFFILIIFGLVNFLPAGKQALPLLKVEYPKPVTLDLQSGWVISAQTVRDYPFWGSGPGTYLFDFTRYRPFWFNQTEDWNKRFPVSNNEYLQILATLGVFGFLSFSFLTLKFIQYAFTKLLKRLDLTEHPLKVGLTASLFGYFTAMALSTSSIVISAVFIFILAAAMALQRITAGAELTDYSLSLRLSTPQTDAEGVLVSREPKEIMPLLVFIPGLLLIVASGYLLTRYVSANYYYRQSLNLLSQGQGGQAYVLQQQAIAQNPLEDTYRVAFSQVNLALANSVAGKENPTDKDKQTIAALLDQSVREAKYAAVTLNPLNVGNWENLAAIYKSLAAAVAGSADWALGSYQQAIQTDPPNPQLRLDLGGLLFAAEKYDQAISLFREAATLKPNLANAHYNLANAFKKKQDWQNAWIEYQNTQKLVTAGTPDAKKIEEEMAEIKDKVEALNTQNKQAQPESKSTPSAATPSGIKR